MWTRVDTLIDRARTLDDLREHRLELLAARRWRALGRRVPAEVVEEERHAAVMNLSVPLLLEKIRAVVDGPVVLFKGPEVAVRYPDPALRPYGDLDLLVEDAPAAHAALLDAGFTEVGDPELYRDIHHLRPLQLYPVPLLVEIHAAPKWIDSLRAPPTSELIAAAVPSRTGGEAILTLRPEHHALVLAVHSWAHEPLRRLLELVDIAVMTEDADRAVIERIADDWGIGRLWKTTVKASDAVLTGNAGTSLPFHLWARNVPLVRSRTVFEGHLGRWLADFWALPLQKALRMTAVAAVRMIKREPDERWAEKLARMRLAVRDASTARSYHERVLDDRRRHASENGS